MSTRKTIFGFLVCFSIVVFVGQSLSQPPAGRPDFERLRSMSPEEKVRYFRRMAEKQRRMAEEQEAQAMKEALEADAGICRHRAALSEQFYRFYLGTRSNRRPKFRRLGWGLPVPNE